jgi:hypothetical protein
MANQFRARVAAIGIRERLVLLVLAMLVPWIVLFATTYASYQRDHERDTRARLRDLAAQVGARVDDQLGTVDGLLVAIAEGASADPASVARNDEILRRLREELPPYITNLALWGVDGHNIGSSDADPARARKMEVAAHRFFREALAATHLTVGRPIESRETGGWSLTMARRIRQDGTITGVASVSARLDILGPIPRGRHARKIQHHHHARRRRRYRARPCGRDAHRCRNPGPHSRPHPSPAG